MQRRGTLVLAMITALLGAPSTAFAAGNNLTSPTASPSSGTVETAFTLRVTYEGQFAATAVWVSVAGVRLPLMLVAGSSTAGTWGVSTTLPAGTWTPTFTASALRGNTASVVGGPITVAGLAGSPAAPMPTLTSSFATGGGQMDTGQAIEPGDPAAPPADDGGGTLASSDDPVPASTGDSSPAGTRSGGSGPGGPSGTTGSPAPDGGGGTSVAPAGGAREVQPGGGTEITPAAEHRDGAAESDPAVDAELPDLGLLVGLSGVATVALIGTALLVIGRRRSTTDEGVPLAELAETDAILERRTVRRAKVRLTEDPIVAAMGVGDQVAARRRRATGTPPADVRSARAPRQRR